MKSWLMAFGLVSVLLADNEATKLCFNCNGAGLVKCPSCRNGQMDCLGPCLKLSRGSWRHMNVPGHGPNELWQSFKSNNGHETKSWNQTHVGEVIGMRNGQPENIGKCKTCGGTGRLTCTRCKGAGTTVCEICDGQKVVPVAWRAFNNPKLKNKPKAIRLKDGREIVGKFTMSSGTTVWIKTEDGKTIKVDKDEIQDLPSDLQ